MSEIVVETKVQEKDKEDIFGYGKMSADQIRKQIAELVKQNEDLLEKKKEYTKDTNSIINDNKKRLKNALKYLPTASLVEAATKAENK